MERSEDLAILLLTNAGQPRSLAAILVRGLTADQLTRLTACAESNVPSAAVREFLDDLADEQNQSDNEDTPPLE